MIDSNDCVTLSDDDDDINQVPEETINGKKRIKSKSHKHKRIKSTETIVLDDEAPNCNENNNIIELPDSQELNENKPLLKLEKIRQEDQLFSEFIEKCLDLENSDGMIRIIHKNVVKCYEECDKEYRKSPKFQRVIMKALKQLDTDPDHKFSHVKNLVETMKLHKQKKRVQLTTLATNLKDNGYHHKNGFPRKSRINSIILDSDDEQKDIPTIDLDNYQNDIIEVLDEEKENHIESKNSLPNGQDLPVVDSNVQVFTHQQKVPDKNQNPETNESLLSYGTLPNSQENFLEPQVEVSWDANIKIQAYSVQQEIPIEYVPIPPPLNEKEEKIKAIEREIALCKHQITRFEIAEVHEDSLASPYILCERYKAQVVQLYKQLCALTGDQPIKQRKVRLQVLEGHPPGPTKRLETFINDNIGEDGIPLFPDFLDVIKCVMVANIEDKMGWSKQQVMKEANSLFTQCGRALQKQRQRREYRDLLSRVKVEPGAPCDPVGYDPAEHDPELQRKLEENRRIAVKKENDLLEKYVRLQYLPTQKPRLGPDLEHAKKIETSHINGDLRQENTSQEHQIENTQPNSSSHLQKYLDNNQENQLASSSSDKKNHIKNNDKQKVQPISSSEINLENHQPSSSNGLPNDLIEIPQPSPASDVMSDEDSDFEPPEVQLSQETKTDLEPGNKLENKDAEVKVKQEPIDIAQMLADLGDNYTTAIIDIEDPFLVIEISSDDDSSDEEMHVEGESSE
ncbi:hypothetical protein NE865_09744 [Phthorimaea operculella]|nr:hypothetical protein NE865_09744 [Phthorimaea operculella]